MATKRNSQKAKQAARKRKNARRIQKGRGAYTSNMRRKKKQKDNRIWVAVAAVAVLAAAVAFLPLGKKNLELSIERQELKQIETYLVTDSTLNVYNAKTKKVETMALEDYIVCVVAGEMPASYEKEALKAQAVAARTYTVSKIRSAGGGGCNQGENADICTSSAHCQAFVDLETRKANWGADYAVYEQKIEEAVAETAGQILVYDGKPIEALYHASSGGKTEDVENVYSNALPYLKSVDSPGEGTMGSNSAEKKFTNEEFVQIFKEKYPEMELYAENLQGQITIVSRYESGRVETIKIGDKTFSGKDMRSILGLNSANFKIRFAADSLTFETSGFGHGVGMSQAGANAMAQAGSSYDEILTHYYTGVEIKTFSENASS